VAFSPKANYTDWATTNKNTGTLIDASKEVGLEVNTERTDVCWCLVTSMQVKTGSCNQQTAFEHVSQVKYVV
jgi:hypothetical protein